jgi:hypothetical protein
MAFLEGEIAVYAVRTQAPFFGLGVGKLQVGKMLKMRKAPPLTKA